MQCYDMSCQESAVLYGPYKVSQLQTRQFLVRLQQELINGLKIYLPWSLSSVLKSFMSYLHLFSFTELVCWFFVF